MASVLDLTGRVVTPPSLPLPWRFCTNCSRLRTDGNYVVAVRRWHSRIVRRHGLVGRRIRGAWSRHGCGCPEAICCPSAQPKGPDVSSAWIRASSSEHSRRQGQLAGCYSRHRTADSHTPDHSTPFTSLSRRFCADRQRARPDGECMTMSAKLMFSL